MQPNEQTIPPVFPEKLSEPRPESDAFGDTSKGAVGEQQMRNATNNAAPQGAVDLVGDKKANAPGPDGALAFKDEETGQTVTATFENKDYNNPTASTFQDSLNKTPERLDSIHNEIASVGGRVEQDAAGNFLPSYDDLAEPWASNVRTENTSYYNEPIEPTFTNEEVDPWADFEPQESMWEAQMNEINAEQAARFHGGYDQVYATTTDESLKGPSVEKIAEQGFNTIHIEEPPTGDLVAGAPTIDVPIEGVPILESVGNDQPAIESALVSESFSEVSAPPDNFVSEPISPPPLGGNDFDGGF